MSSAAHAEARTRDEEAHEARVGYGPEAFLVRAWKRITHHKQPKR